MNSSTKLATGLALACTWTTAAHAEDFHLDFVANQDISDIRLYTYRVEAGSAPGAANRPDETLTSVLGPMLANETYTYNVSTNYGTSTVDNLGSGDMISLNILGTFADGDIATAGNVNNADTPFNNVAPAVAVSGILSGDLPIIRSLTQYTQPSGNPISFSTYGAVSSQSFSLANSVTLYRFDTSGSRTSIGTITASRGLGTERLPGAPVPEPATLAALGMGGLALLRRRRKA